MSNPAVTARRYRLELERLSVVLEASRMIADANQRMRLELLVDADQGAQRWRDGNQKQREQAGKAVRLTQDAIAHARSVLAEAEDAMNMLPRPISPSVTLPGRSTDAAPVTVTLLNRTA